MRHPSAEEANQQHTTRKYAQSHIPSEQGIIIASRTLTGEQSGRPGIYSAMEFGTGFLGGNGMRTHTDNVPYFTHQPGRYGDEMARHRELEVFGAKALASQMFDEGGEADLPDDFYMQEDGSEDCHLNP